MSVFDPDSFLETSTEGAMDTQYKPIPVGEYAAVIEDIKLQSFPGKDGEERHVLNVIYNIIDSDLLAELERDKVTVRQSIWLDLTPTGAFDLGPGKNVGLGKLRAAVGQNHGSWAPRMLKGAGPLLVNVGHRPAKNSDEIYAEVKSVGKVG